MRKIINKIKESRTKKPVKHHKKHSRISHVIREVVYIILGVALLFTAVAVVWVSTIKLPDFNNFENRKIANSTKIYDRTGKILLYNVYDNIKRTQVGMTDINDNIKKATIAIEDTYFYSHHGIRPTSIIRAVIASLKEGRYAQGGSTITQQVVKNALLTQEKSVIRKVKEWVLAIKLDNEVDKDSILNIYLNESPYGGTIYGVEEASLSYFGKNAKDVTMAEAAYLAAMPQAPSRYSPFNNDRQALENRKNLVLTRMFETGAITQEELDNALAEKVIFLTRDNSNGKAFHFVFYVREYLENKYGKDVVENGGLKVITTLDYDLQKNGEEIVKEGALKNTSKFGAENGAMITIDPRTGQILAMVGSRDYFDKAIDGKYNVATALRQPGSTFKPIVYLLGLVKGFEPETVLYDVPTQFSTNCDAYGNTIDGGKCYMPSNYDGNFHGPVSLRVALQNSINIPAIKLLYLVGIKSTVDFAKKFGITSLDDYSRFGLSLVLGGGEVSLLEMTNVYATFANEGIYNPSTPILEIKDKEGNILETFSKKSREVVSKEYTDKLSDMLSDADARSLTFSYGNPINYHDRQVAGKTGTTNDFRDTWVIGYTPSYAIGLWAGNNDNRPVSNVAGAVLSPVWRKYMDYVLNHDGKVESFDTPIPISSTAPNFINGNYCADGPGTILRYIGGSGSAGGYTDPQYNLWNTPILSRNYCGTSSNSTSSSATSNPSSTQNIINSIIPVQAPILIPTTTSN
jgi:1A family penicillin-binding protein